MSNEIKVGIVGTQFMRRAHSNAYRRVSDFFDLPAPPLLRAACDVNPSDLDAFAQRFGWQTKETSCACQANIGPPQLPQFGF